MDFDFEKVYDHFAKPMDGETLDEPFGPHMFMVKEPTSETPKGFMFNKFLILSIMARDGGNDQMDQLIAKILEQHGDDFCVVLVHEGHVKQVEDPTPEEEVELKNRGLSKDPNARHVASVSVYHKSGSVTGFCTLDDKRKATYKPLVRDEKLLRVNVGVSQDYLH